MALQIELDGGRVHLLAIVKGDIGAQLQRQGFAVRRPLVAGGQLRHDGQFFVDLKQLVAQGRKHHAAHKRARQRGVENVRVFGQAHAQGLRLHRQRRCNQQQGWQPRAECEFH